MAWRLVALRTFRLSGAVAAKTLAVVALAAAIVLAPPAARATVIPDFVWKGGNWNGYVWTDSETGAFSQCTVQVGSFHFVDLVLSFGDDFGFSMTLVSDRWSLDVGETGEAEYRFSGGRPRFATAYAHQPNAVRIDLPDNASTLNRFRRARQVDVSSFVGNFTFGLAGSNRAILWGQDCAQAHINAQAATALLEDSPPTEEANWPAAPDAEANEQRDGQEPSAAVSAVEATQIVPVRAAIVLASALSEAVGETFIMTARDSPNAIGWSTQSLSGAMELLPSSFDGVRELRGELIGRVAAGCNGAFTTQNIAAEQAVDMRMSMQCDRLNEDPLATQYTLIHTDVGYALLRLEGPPERVLDIGEPLVGGITKRIAELEGPTL